MLIKIDPDCFEYIDFDSSNGIKYGIPSYSPIAMYNEDGFMSFTFHYQGSISNMILETRGSASERLYYYADFTYDKINSDQFRNVRDNYHIIKIALLDRDGNVLSISDEFDVNPKSPNVFLGAVKYNAEKNLIETDYLISAWSVLFYIFFMVSVVIRIAVSITVEAVIAIPFKIMPIWKIVLTNLATQIILVLFMTFCRLPYIQNLIIIETFVYFSEFAVFSIIFKNTSKIKLALYTFVANTASLTIGLLLNLYSAL